ncbi:L-tyrosine/L-tryptophan isonitrile synthase family protein [Legionella oakridgensis]|uniref:Pyoverdine/dityrosine biosynthesis protein n=2 Tax=Legionella oakridgensis TaxID=29423 RepID=W0BDX1_9GAMM|nr:L-tyrosine/L-tryptophan isonitrile synthase family protein [Legionella oakridgensis]AHE66886.1 pyoverdine/dityrosine biosynthesis protein [Legionella oakridgensis ATCC 33761 = DSM 21215]KTD39773.1 pyoverdine biosynthesis protein [Legionella oakridgensis]STY19994.1 pyoverdine biosynthesis protein [Legionella longbeachae]
MPSLYTMKILEVLSEHRRIPQDGEASSITEFSSKIIEIVDAMVIKGEKIRLVMPAFPEKAPVRGKTLSDSPDMAELVSLQHLNNICQKIAAVYPAGAEMVIYTDGFAFDEVFPDIHTKDKRERYLAQLTSMIEQSHLNNIKIVNLSGTVDLNKYAETDASFEERVRKPKTHADIDSLNLYRGEIRFFTTELSMAYPDRSMSRIKKDAAIVARGVARMSAALSTYLSVIEPEALRLSCHPKTVDSDKIGIWFNEDHSPGGTPWHNAAVFEVEKARNKCVVSFMKASEAAEKGFILKTDKEGKPSHFVSEPVFRYASILQSFFKAVHAARLKSEKPDESYQEAELVSRVVSGA